MSDSVVLHNYSFINEINTLNIKNKQHCQHFYSGTFTTPYQTLNSIKSLSVYLVTWIKSLKSIDIGYFQVLMFFRS